MQQGFFVDDMFCQSHQFQLPLDYQQPGGERIQVFAREVVARGQRNADLPWLVYLQGGPGFPSPRPESESGWLKRALKDFRVLLLDQRGTGQSQPVHAQTLSGLTPAQQAEYLSHFRADNIVRDAEAIRESLGVSQWSLLGQSFGGFCALHYLSFYPKSLHHVYMTGGVPPIHGHADAVYQATYRRVLEKNAAFFRRFPDAQAQCNRIADYLLAHDVRLPNGQQFTVEQFQLIGINLGRSGGDLALYYQLENAFVDVNGQSELSYSFLNAMLAEQAYQTNPIYAILHESIYCQKEASRWSAHRVRDEYPQCHYQTGQNFCFTGEMVYPWMFDQLETLKPLQAAAELLAEKSDWPVLYDAKQLAQNTVPVAAAVYVEDMYVEFDLSRQTLNGMPNSDAWMTNEFEHNGLRAAGERILDTLICKAQTIQDQLD
ncbi:alpha/beta fold hydrolase [Photobacterium sp. GJ3]|uniref:alpha/beta fold hydrolase n=1 Tax=Photobacterium sp. GJ3 TaxID=2829502 RepID=UPI001B8CA825|nr:alpha/beta fold hydrolase [Photobacterium sp. GJ3]QUJ68726.1 alpha/beta fold hydrolase [Photobacterium sp. GJ3]